MASAGRLKQVLEGFAMMQCSCSQDVHVELGAYPTFCAGGEFFPHAAQPPAADAALALAAVPELHTSSCDQLAAASARPLHPQFCSHKGMQKSAFLRTTHASSAKCVAPACHQTEK